MSAISVKIAVTGSLFLLTLISGVWLSLSGKPYNIILSSIHKVLSLAAAIFIIVTVYGLSGIIEFRAMAITVIAVTGVFFLLAFISGVLLIAGKQINAIIVYTHRITSGLTLILTALSSLLLAGLKN